MLQQTRVEAVVPYYERFLRRFPDTDSLARAREEDVLAEWAGLGYYRRALDLRRAAALVCEGGGGELPRTAAAWRELPGVGAYTAAAVSSIAFGERVAVVDGNVRRVAARFLRLDEADGPALQRAAAAWAQGLMDALPRGPKEGAGDLNQALMELGATVCRPRAPRCGDCPLAAECEARAAGTPERWPRRAARKPALELRLAFLVAGSGDRWLLWRRMEGWNPGLYEPPSFADGPRRALQRRWAEDGRAGVVGEVLGEVRHAITRHRIRGRVLWLRGWDGRGGVDPARVPLTGLARKVLMLAAARPARAEP